MERTYRKMLTVFTPAYNRAHTLPRTYDSLCRQTCDDFEWLIIDDGSTDNTRELVESWIAENKIPIRYHYQENQGMHGAHNTAYRLINTKLNICIDSDDYMPDNAVERIVTIWGEKGSEKYAGIIGLDQDTHGNIIGTPFPNEVKETTLFGFYERGGKGDKKQAYRTDVINKYPEYPLYKGEKYVGLAYKYYSIDEDYPLIATNDVLCIVEYQEDGSSMNMYRQYWNNPKGFAFYRKKEMQLTRNRKRRFIVCMHYVSSCFRSRNWRFIQESPCKGMTLLATPAGFFLYLYIKYKVSNNSPFKI